MLAVRGGIGHPPALAAETGQGGVNPFPACAGGPPTVVAQGPDDTLGPRVGLFEQGSEACKLGVAVGSALAPDRVTASFEVFTGMVEIHQVHARRRGDLEGSFELG